jgi:hypothetical protein
MEGTSRAQVNEVPSPESRNRRRGFGSWWSPREIIGLEVLAILVGASRHRRVRRVRWVNLVAEREQTPRHSQHTAE